jgi:hypothetical protein
MSLHLYSQAGRLYKQETLGEVDAHWHHIVDTYQLMVVRHMFLPNTNYLLCAKVPV